MIRVAQPAEPATFDQRCRQRGRTWLGSHPNYTRPYDYWTEFKPALQEAFGDLCAYSAMFIPNGEVDHFLPVNLFKQRGEHHLAYEWSNFRYADEYLNKKKSNLRILDPYEIRDDWFELLLPSLELVLTPRVPKRIRPLVERTLQTIGLDRSQAVMRSRCAWFLQYRQGNMTLDGVRKVAPLLARAIDRDLARNLDWRSVPTHR